MKDILLKTISVLNKQEIINYKLYTNRKEYNEEAKGVVLFDLLKNDSKKDINKELIIQKLYGKSEVNTNTFQKLQARLLTEIDNSLVQFYFHETDTAYIHSELSLYHVFLNKNEGYIAYYHLQKAEKRALSVNQFQLLDFIYNEFITLSVQHGSIAPDVFIKKRNENQLQLLAIRQLDDALSSIVYDLTKTQTIENTSAKKLQALNKAIHLFANKKEFKNNILFKGKLFLAISQIFISKRDFSTLEKYSLKTYQEFETKNYFTKNNHAIKLQMLRYICNCLFISKHYNEALKYAQQFHESINDYQGLLFEQNIFFYYNILANNYSIINSEKVIEVLNEAKNIPAIYNHQNHLGYVYINLAGAYLSLKKHKIALKNILNLYLHPTYQNLSVGMQLQVSMIELLIRLEIKDIESSKKLIKSISKTYKNSLTLKEHQADADFLQVISLLISKHEFKKNTKSASISEKYIHDGENVNHGAVVDYKLWLQNEFLKEEKPNSQ